MPNISDLQLAAFSKIYGSGLSINDMWIKFLGSDGAAPLVVYPPTGVAATDTANIQSALTAARLAGGGVVVLQTGTYVVTNAAHPSTASYNCALTIGSKTTLRGMGKGATTIQLAPSQASGQDVSQNHAIIYNYNLGPGDADINIERLTIDGNAANQTHTIGGLCVMRVDRYSCFSVDVINCRGTATSGINETFHFSVDLSSNVWFEGCTARRTAGTTASGFSANGSTFVSYTSCHASGMTTTNGFTHNDCSGVLHVDCTSVLNAGHGFNSEVSKNVKYVSCVAGGTATTSTTAVPWNTSVSLGNTNNGFTANGSLDYTTYVGCTGSNNAQSGITTASCSIIIDGGVYKSNSAGLSITATSKVSGHPIVSGNTVSQYNIPSGYYDPLTNPNIVPTVPTSGTVLTNPHPFDCMVYVSGGTVSAIHSGGYPTGLTSGGFLIAAGMTIKLTYTVAPSWVWVFGG